MSASHFLVRGGPRCNFWARVIFVMGPPFSLPQGLLDPIFSQNWAGVEVGVEVRHWRRGHFQILLRIISSASCKWRAEMDCAFQQSLKMSPRDISRPFLLELTGGYKMKLLPRHQQLPRDEVTFLRCVQDDNRNGDTSASFKGHTSLTSGVARGHTRVRYEERQRRR